MLYGFNFLKSNSNNFQASVWSIDGTLIGTTTPSNWRSKGKPAVGVSLLKLACFLVCNLELPHGKYFRIYY